MGTSNWQAISYCCDLIHSIAPRRTLDIGVGSVGRWAMLVREFVDIWGGHVLPEEWTSVVDGIEAFEPMLRPLHYAMYDHIYVGDAFEMIDRLDHYDLIILGDVIEHFAPERARVMLGKCLQHAGLVLVVTPLGDLETWPQDSMYDNPWEEHKTVFSQREFLESRQWLVLHHREFKDYVGREFGAFLLRSCELGNFNLS